MSEGSANNGQGELIGRLKAKLKEQARKLEEQAARIAGLDTERQQAIQQRDEARTSATQAEEKFNSDPLKGEVERLKGEIRTRDHRAVFDRLATERGADKAALDLLYGTSGYEIKDDTPDEKAIGTLLDELKGKPGVSRLFGEPAAERRPAPASGQGGMNGGSGKLKATVDQMRDPHFCLEHRKAIREKQYEIID